MKNIPNEENMYIIFLLLIAFPLLKLINIYLLIAFPLELIENNCVTYFNSIAYALRSKNKVILYHLYVRYIYGKSQI